MFLRCKKRRKDATFSSEATRIFKAILGKNHTLNLGNQFSILVN